MEMHTKRASRGFTLIELLVVIAIIGILSGIVIGSLNRARDRGNDAKVKAQIASIRATAEQYYDEFTSYNGVAGDVLNDCTTVDSMFQDSSFGMDQYTALTSYPIGTTLRCSSTADDYMVSASLSSSGEFWCVDSTGSSKQITAVDHPTAHPDGDNLCD